MGPQEKAATEEWEREVDAKAALLIRNGTNPRDARAEAHRIVADRRKHARRLDGDDLKAVLAAMRADA